MRRYPKWFRTKAGCLSVSGTNSHLMTLQHSDQLKPLRIKVPIWEHFVRCSKLSTQEHNTYQYTQAICKQVQISHTYEEPV